MADNVAPLILLTRPRLQSERFAAKFNGIAETHVMPLQEIVPTGDMPALGAVKGLIFTSENAARTFAELSEPRGWQAWCVGWRTAHVARSLGFDATEGPGTADALVAQIIEAGPEPPLLHLHGRHTRGAVASRLSAAGIKTLSVAIYDQRAIEPSRPIAPLGRSRLVIAPLFSPRSASLLEAHIPQDPKNWRFPCLSQAVLAALPDVLRLNASVAQEPSSEAMYREVLHHISP